MQSNCSSRGLAAKFEEICLMVDEWGNIIKPDCLKNFYAYGDMENNKDEVIRISGVYLLQNLSTANKDIWLIKKSIFIIREIIFLIFQ